MFEYRQALVRMRQGDSDRDIARSKLMGRKKAAQLRGVASTRGWLQPEQPLPEDGELAAVLPKPGTSMKCVSTLQGHREQIEAWARAGVQGTTIHEALGRKHGFSGSYSAVRRMLQSIRAEEPVPATMILDFDPAEASQVDFGAGPLITDVFTGETFKTWVFVMTLCFSRHQYAELVRDQSVMTWLSCHRHAFEWFNGVVGRVIIDNPKCAITRACVHDPEVQRSYAECAEGFGFKIDPCPPRDPAKKGIVESGVKYVKRAFLPLREFRSLADANEQLLDWVMEVAGNRVHGTTRELPLTRFAQIEKPLLKALPDVPPELARWAKLLVHRDSHVQLDKCLYSVPYRHVSQTVWMRASATTARIFHEHQLVAVHPRLWRPGARSTLPDHLPPDALAWSLADPQWCLRQAEGIGASCHELVRRLFSDRVLERLRAVQALLRLRERYGVARLEAACCRALTFDAPTYRSVKTILAKGLDQQEALAAFDQTTDLYARGGRFLRTPDGLVH
jgi:transposase